MRSALLVYLIAAAATFGLPFLVVTLMLSGRVGAFDAERDALTLLLVAAPTSSLPLVVIALLAAPRPRRLALRLVPGRWPGWTALATVVGILGLSQALESLIGLLRLSPGPTIDWMTRALAAASVPGLLLAVLLIGGLAPLCEELFFRGYLQTRLRERWGAGPAIVIAALAFGFVHGHWVHAAVATGLGVYLGIITERSGSVIPAVIGHAANNTAAVLASWLGRTGEGSAHVAVLIVGALAFTAALVWLRRLARAPSA